MQDKLTPKQIIVIAILLFLLFGLPAIFVSLNVGPGQLVNGTQDMLIGGHSLKLSWLLVCLIHCALLGGFAWLVKWLTGGRTLAGYIMKWMRKDNNQ